MYEDYENYGLVNYPLYNLNRSYEYDNENKEYNSRNLDSNMSDVLEVIVESMEDEKEDALFYEFLISSTTRENEKEMIRAIRDDEKRHSMLLRQLYKSITGMDYMSKNQNMQTKSMITNMTYLQGLEKAFKNEIKAFEKYRKILFLVTNKEDYNKLFEIMTDEMKHAIKYNYLITKNMK